MTLPPEKIGDQGQRYVIKATGYPDPDREGWQDIGYSDSKASAVAMMRRLAQIPSVGRVWIKDRSPD